MNFLGNSDTRILSLSVASREIMSIYHFLLLRRDMFFIFEFLSLFHFVVFLHVMLGVLTDEENIAYVILKEPNLIYP
jgi:hypothetical protein